MNGMNAVHQPPGTRDGMPKCLECGWSLYVRRRTAESTEPHGEHCYDEWDECQHCGARLPEPEVIMEEEACPNEM